MPKSSRPAERAKKELAELVRIQDEAIQNAVGPNRSASTVQASKEATAAVIKKGAELRGLMDLHQAARAARAATSTSTPEPEKPKRVYAMSKREQRAEKARLAASNSTDPDVIAKAKTTADAIEKARAARIERNAAEEGQTEAKEDVIENSSIGIIDMIDGVIFNIVAALWYGLVQCGINFAFGSANTFMLARSMKEGARAVLSPNPLIMPLLFGLESNKLGHHVLVAKNVIEGVHLTYMDSAPGFVDRGEIRETVLKILRNCEWMSEIGQVVAEEWRVSTVQRNGNTCGAHVIVNAWAYMPSMPLKDGIRWSDSFYKALPSLFDDALNGRLDGLQIRDFLRSHRMVAPGSGLSDETLRQVKCWQMNEPLLLDILSGIQKDEEESKTATASVGPLSPLALPPPGPSSLAPSSVLPSSVVSHSAACLPAAVPSAATKIVSESLFSDDDDPHSSLEDIESDAELSMEPPVKKQKNLDAQAGPEGYAISIARSRKSRKGRRSTVGG